MSGPNTLLKMVHGFFKDTIVDFAIMFSEPLIKSTPEDHRIPLII